MTVRNMRGEDVSVEVEAEATVADLQASIQAETGAIPNWISACRLSLSFSLSVVVFGWSLPLLPAIVGLIAAWPLSLLLIIDDIIYVFMLQALNRRDNGCFSTNAW